MGELPGTDRLAEWVERVEAAVPELERLERLHPQCTSLADVLNKAGKAWADVGLTAEDGARLDEVFTRIHDA
ncbi:hypothetical protein [Streptomyces cinnamoneus]|uniref:Uncharacterized protein n=1 Tax=Streptomyces cinnamoneus TaxID=53446 RepID=A0A918U0X0_STRCJ|nr:hypothetical protein [Streptomyces cinnamoneus]GHC73082.1 hypothetical protein GCM10010507_60420 [Streptomyces cinnamoneus]